MGSTIRKGQRLRPLHPAFAEREWGVPRDAVGTVLCCYRPERGADGERVDVKFSSGPTLWGAPAKEFKIVAEGHATVG
jgi:hypothetical protein